MTHAVGRDRPQPILAHLEELRKRIIVAALAVVAASVVALLFAQEIKDLLEGPYDTAFPDNPGLVALTPTEQFGVLMRIAFFGGLVLASPVVFYQVWAFVNPALSNRERRWAVPIVASFVLLFATGVTFAYWTLPKGLGFLLGIFDDVSEQLRIGDYFSFVIRFLLVFGIAFQYPVFLFAAAAAGLVSTEQLARGRRWAVLVIVTVGAMITPTGDPLTLVALSLPLYLFYEATYWLVRLVLRR